MLVRFTIVTSCGAQLNCSRLLLGAEDSVLCGWEQTVWCTGGVNRAIGERFVMCGVLLCSVLEWVYICCNQSFATSVNPSRIFMYVPVRVAQRLARMQLYAMKTETTQYSLDSQAQ